jgi:hypothetical protein
VDSSERKRAMLMIIITMDEPRLAGVRPEIHLSKDFTAQS